MSKQKFFLIVFIILALCNVVACFYREAKKQTVPSPFDQQKIQNSPSVSQNQQPFVVSPGSKQYGGSPANAFEVPVINYDEWQSDWEKSRN